MKNKNKDVYGELVKFKQKYPTTIAWRIKKHAEIIEKHLNPGEEVKYAFVAQKNNNPFDIASTNAIVLTNKRLLIGTRRLIFGYFLTAITPDLFNDLEVKMSLIFGKIKIDTLKEEVYLSNIDRNALDEIETEITEFMMNKKSKTKC